MLSSVQALLAEHAELQQQLSEASVHANPVLAKKLNRRYAELNAIVSAYHVVNETQADLDAAKDMAKEDESFADEVPAMEEKLHEATEKLRRLLIPRDPDDGRDVIMEIKAGEGGAESALFAADLFRMYIQYANSKGWKTEILDKNESDLGGYKDVQIAIKGKSSDPAEGVWAHLKYEGGVHRVQRVPVTETQGRIHTSAAGVLVFPEVDAPEELEIAANEIRVQIIWSWWSVC
jgi:peptide chain release factor 1